MSRSCKGICDRFPRLSPIYKDGKKCCRHCEVFMVCDDILCPCCKNPLAVKPRANRTQLLRRTRNALMIRIAQQVIESGDVVREVK